MRYKTCASVLVLALTACGDDVSGGLSADLSATAVDSAAPADLSVSPDLTPAPVCSKPKPGLYDEVVSYVFVSATGGSPGVTNSNDPVAVREDGALVRPPNLPIAPDRFHCSFDLLGVDAKSCTVPCCPGQTTSPIVFVNSGGWAMWVQGSCVFTTANGAQYIATPYSIDGRFNR